MILIYFNNKQSNHLRLLKHLYRSYRGVKMIQATGRFDKNVKMNRDADLIIFAGMIRGEGLIYQWCKEHNKDFLYIDHAYLNRGYNMRDPKNEWMRITKNSFAWNRLEARPNDRWLAHFKPQYSLAPWRGGAGKNILVLPPSEATKFLFPESVDWTRNTVEELKKYTDAPIIVREKPLQPQIDPHTNQVIGRLDFKHEHTIDYELMYAKCVVAFNSAVPVQAAVLGIPSITAPVSCAYPISFRPHEIENTTEPKRQPWLDQLVYHQYTTEELITGKFWEMI